MKQLFIGLIVLNLCYLLFQQLTTEDSERVTSQVQAAASSVSLGPALEPVPRAEVSVSGVSEVRVELPEPVPDSAAQIALMTGESATQTKDTTGPVESKLVASAGVAGTQSELVSAANAATITQAAPSCVIAGPFRARQEGLALVTQLDSAGIEATLEPRDTAILPDYMVYVGPEKSTAEARALEAKFKARQMDSHVIAAGDLQNALSLGVFSRGPLARSLHQQLENEGYQAHISELTRNRRGYQVRTRLPPLIRAKLIEADTPIIDCP